jgi:2-polyprenyl-6-methoxyphenol hydroxylase-like FAD-dependent oxidoreductase
MAARNPKATVTSSITTAVKEEQTVGENSVQVLVVGAGPAGLTLASELLAQGVSVRIIDQRDGAVTESRALALHARSLELFDAAGIADRMVAAGQPMRRMHMYVDGTELMRLEFRHNGSCFGYGLGIPQRETELILRERIVELGGEVTPRMELLAFEQSEAGVLARVRDSEGAVQSIKAEYMVGCDGAHSRVRHGLGLKFEGRPYPERWLMADSRADWDTSPDESHAFFRSRGGAVVLLPLPGRLWRVVLPFVGERAPGNPTLEEIQTLVDQRVPRKLVLSDPIWLTDFSCQLRLADRYRVGRVFLAGDAAHVHTPAGGQGMNVAIQDAFNLAWKLGLVLSGFSPDWLLDTYEAERRPVAERVLKLTDGIVTMARIANPVKRLLRDTIVPFASRLPAIQKRATRRTGQLHVSYRRSRLAVGALAGDRMPDVQAGGKRLYESLRSRKHVLITPKPLVGLERHSEHVDVVTGKDTVLVRPDGYVAARGIAVREYLNEVFSITSLARREPAEDVA